MQARSSPPVALLNIGQAPRHDLSEAIERGLPADVQVRHVGALDGLSRAIVERDFAPAVGQAWLISRLADGGTITLDAHKIGRCLQDCIDRLEGEGVETVVLLCTGAFPHLRTSRSWLVEPDVVVCDTVASLLGDARAGVLVPLPQQIDEARAKWRRLKQPPLFAAASPYAQGTDSLLQAARDLASRGAQALVLDCLGYAQRHKQALRGGGCTLPVLVSGGVLAGALGALLREPQARRVAVRGSGETNSSQ